MEARDIIFAPILQAGKRPLVVDVGARNGMHTLPAWYTSETDLVGFEPNEEECAKLEAGTTDSFMAGHRMPDFHSTKFHPAAVWNTDGHADLHLTQSLGACTMLGEFTGNAPDRIFSNGRTLRSAVGNITETVSVPCRKLDSVIDDDAVIDFLKIDVEGGELHVLGGAETLLKGKRVLFAQLEFFTVSFRPNCPVFGEQHALLHERGYRLIDLLQDHARYTRDRSSIPALNDRSMLLAGDGIYILDPDENDIDPVTRARMGAITLAYGYHSLGISLFRDSGLYSESEIARIEQHFSSVPLLRRLKAGWIAFPQKVANKLAATRRRLG